MTIGNNHIHPYVMWGKGYRERAQKEKKKGAQKGRGGGVEMRYQKRRRREEGRGLSEGSQWDRHEDHPVCRRDQFQHWDSGLVDLSSILVLTFFFFLCFPFLALLLPHTHSLKWVDSDATYLYIYILTHLVVPQHWNFRLWKVLPFTPMEKPLENNGFGSIRLLPLGNL